MKREVSADEVAAALRGSIGLLARRVRQASQSDGDLTWTERATLGRLERSGPATSAEMARLEQISPQSMGTTLAELERRGLVERRPDPEDGRRIVVSVTAEGQLTRRTRRDAQTEQLAKILSAEFTRSELQHLMAAAPLVERLAQNL
jgi:DNA-binding MarR family transcriptional regulator